MKFTLEIDADNAAFHGAGCPDTAHECAGQALQIVDLLQKVIGKIEAYGLNYWVTQIHDPNGNPVGTFCWMDKG